MLKQALFAAAAASLSLGACATDRYGYDDYGDNDRQLERAATGAAIGAAAGAAVGAVSDDIEIEHGAVVGAIAGGAIGAATAGSDRRWYRDNRGYCFYVDRSNRRIYDYDRRNC